VLWVNLKVMYELYASKRFVTEVKYKNKKSKKRRRIISSSFPKVQTDPRVSPASKSIGNGRSLLGCQVARDLDPSLTSI